MAESAPACVCVLKDCVYSCIFLCVPSCRASPACLLLAGRPERTDQGEHDRRARARPLPQLQVRKGVNMTRRYGRRDAACPARGTAGPQWRHRLPNGGGRGAKGDTLVPGSVSAPPPRRPGRKPPSSSPVAPCVQIALEKTVSVRVCKTRKSPTTVDSASSRRCVSGNRDTYAAVCAYGGPEEVGLAHPKGLTSGRQLVR